MTRFLLIPIGSAGDVHPFLAIGQALQAKGHLVTCATNPYFQPQVARLGLSFAPLGTTADYLAATASQDMWNPRTGLKFVVEHGFAPAIRPVYDLIAQQDLAQTTVVASTFAFGARLAQEKLGAKVISVHLQPSAFWSIERPAVAPGVGDLSRWPSPLRRWCLGTLERFYLDRLFGKGINALRHELGLPGQATGILSQWIHSPQKTLALFPSWFAAPASDWPRALALTDFVAYDGDTHDIPPALEEFLASGEAPLVFTPGTAVGAAPEFLAEASKAARLLGRRAILLSSHMTGHLDTSLCDGHVQAFKYAPFSKILPRCRALIHHGGIGTLAQGLAAGLPQLIRPFGFDQPDNARYMENLGVGATIRPQDFKAKNIAARLDTLLASSAVQKACQHWAGQVDFAKGLEATCREIAAL